MRQRGLQFVVRTDACLAGILNTMPFLSLVPVLKLGLDVKNNAPARDRRGSWGSRAGIETFGGELLDLGHFANTLATMLRVPKPITGRAVLLVYEENNEFKATIEKAKQS